jgi:RNA polymerase sigma-70 factor (ECF subfamily)
MDHIDEPSLVASCQAGRLEDFDPLYRAYVSRIYAYLYRRTLHREVAEDLTSQTFIKALEGIGGYAPRKGPFAAWLYTIARNALTDHFRSRRETVDIENVWDLSSDADVQSDVGNRLEYEKLREALQNLDAHKREIVMLRLWDGLSYKEIAALTGKTETNCKVIFSRTLDSLRKELPLLAFLLLLLSPFRP